VNQLILKAMLAEAGARATVAATGMQALELLSQQRFDLVLMDMDMPELDGAAATREWRRIEAAFGVPRTHFVCISADGAEMGAARLADAGLDAALAKPFTLAALRSCLDRWASVAASAYTYVYK
jgi:CheY-like chemotaxis protein